MTAISSHLRAFVLSCEAFFSFFAKVEKTGRDFTRRHEGAKMKVLNAASAAEIYCG